MQIHIATIDRSYSRLVRAPRRIAVTLLAFILTFLASRTALAQDDGTTPTFLLQTPYQRAMSTSARARCLVTDSTRRSQSTLPGLR